MTKLECTVKNCMHNNEHCCCISNICVEGIKAVNEAETCCNSFVEKRDHFSNSIDKEKNPVVDVSCKATNCAYNDECKCQAGDICICGHEACDCGETRCGTFKLH